MDNGALQSPVNLSLAACPYTCSFWHLQEIRRVRFPHGPILSIGDIMTRKVLQWGNSKLHKSIGIFSLLPGNKEINGVKGTCGKQCPGCYAVKSLQWATVRTSWAYNTQLARENIPALEQEISLQITRRRKPITAIRIHVAGDFFSKEYLQMWVRIAKRFPKIKFYGYSKSKIALEYKEYPKNMVIHRSLVDNHVNYGSYKYIQELNKKTKNSWICPCGPGKKVICGETCSECINRSAGFPLFIQH